MVTQNKPESTLTPAQKAFVAYRRRVNPDSWFSVPNGTSHRVAENLVKKGVLVKKLDKVSLSDLYHFADTLPQKNKSIPAAMPAPATLYPFTTPPQRMDSRDKIRRAGLGSDERSTAGNLTAVNRIWQALEVTLAEAAAELPAGLVDELKADFDYDTMSVNTWERNAALAERLQEAMQPAYCDIHDAYCRGVVTEWIDDETPLNVCAVHRAERQRINQESEIYLPEASEEGDVIFYPTQEVIHITEWGSTQARVTRSMFTDAWYYDITMQGKTLYNVRSADLTPVGAAPAAPAQRFAIGDAVTISDSHDLWYGRQGKISAAGWQQAGSVVRPVYHVTHASGYTYAYIPEGMLRHTPILLTDPRPTADDYRQRAHELENQCWVHIGENFRDAAGADYWKQQTAWFAHVVNFLSTPPADPQPVPVPSDPPYGDGDEVFVEGLKGTYRIIGEGIWNDSAWWFTAEQGRQRVFVPASSLSIFSPSAARWVGFYAYMKTAPIAEHITSRFDGVEKVAVVKMQGGFATVRRGKLHTTLHYRNLTLTDERVPAEDMAAEVPTFESRVTRQHREVIAERAARQAVQA